MPTATTSRTILMRVPPPPARATPTATTSRTISNAGAAAAGAGYANRNNSRTIPTRAPPPRVRAMPTATTAELSQRGCRGRGCGLCEPQPVQPVPSRHGQWLLERQQLRRLGHDGAGLGAASGVGAWGAGSPMYSWGYSGYGNPYSGDSSGSGGGAQAAAVQQARRRDPAGRGAGLQLLPADQHDRRRARAVRHRPGDRGVRPGPRGVQGGRLCQRPATRPAVADADAQRHDAARVPRPGALRARQVRAGRGTALRGPLGRTRLGLDDLERNVSRRRRPTPGSSATWKRISRRTPNRPRPASCWPTSTFARGTRERRRPAQAGRGAPAGGHALGAARRPVAAHQRHPAVAIGSAPAGTGRRGEAGRELGGQPRTRSRPGDPGRRPLHLGHYQPRASRR